MSSPSTVRSSSEYSICSGIREADITDLSSFDQGIERRDGLLDGSEGVFPMHPIEVDIVGLKASQGRLAIRKNALAVRSASIGVAAVHVAAELRRDDETIALRRIAPDMVADDPLGMAW